MLALAQLYVCDSFAEQLFPSDQNKVPADIADICLSPSRGLLCICVLWHLCPVAHGHICLRVSVFACSPLCVGIAACMCVHGRSLH